MTWRWAFKRGIALVWILECLSHLIKYMAWTIYIFYSLCWTLNSALIEFIFESCSLLNWITYRPMLIQPGCNSGMMAGGFLPVSPSVKQMAKKMEHPEHLKGLQQKSSGKPITLLKAGYACHIWINKDLTSLVSGC